MKTHLLLLLIFLLSANIYIAKAQTYIPFPEPGMQQGDYYSGNIYNSPPNGNVSIRYTGDTIYNGVTYAKFCRHDSWDTTWCASWGVSFYTRFDTGKVYMVNTDFTNEILYYDFSLNVGDSFALVSGFDASKAVVIARGSITTTDGLQRRTLRLQMNNPGNSRIFSWIEGIGDSVGGFLNEYDFEGGYTTLICHTTVNGKVYESSSTLARCDTLFPSTISGITEPPKENVLSTGPNPFTQQLTYHLNTANGHVKLYTALGQPVYNAPANSTGQIATSTFSSGIYYFVWTDERGVATSRRLLKL